MTKRERFQRIACTDSVRGDLKRKSVGATSRTLSVGLADFAIRLGSTAVLARILRPEDFGLVMMLTALLALGEQFNELGLSSATVQRQDISHEQVSNLFWINFAVGCCIATLFALSGPAIANYYNEPKLESLALVLASTFIAGALSVQHQALLTRQLKLHYTSTIRFLANLLSTGLSLYLAWRGFGVWALVWREVARPAFVAIGMWSACAWIPSLPSRTNVRPLLRFGAHLTGANLLGALSNGADRFFLGRLYGPEPVAVFRQAYQLLLVPMDQFLSPLYQVTRPGLSILQAEPDRYRRYYLRVLRLVGLCTMPTSIFVAVHATEIVALLLGPKWAACAPVLLVLSLSAFIRQPIESSSMVLITRGKSGAYFRLSLLSNVALILCFAVGSYWGAVGVAVAEVAFRCGIMVPKLRYSLHDSPISAVDAGKLVGRIAIASLLTGGVVWTLHGQVQLNGVVISLLLGTISSLVLFPILWSLLPGGANEMKSLVDDFRFLLRRDLLPPSSHTSNPKPKELMHKIE